MRIAVLASGSGSNFEALLHYCRDHQQGLATIELLIINNPGCGAQQRAEKYNIPWLLINHRDFDSRESFDDAILKALQMAKIDLVVLAGWMRIITAKLIDAFPSGRLLNIHPSLLPEFKGSAAIAAALAAGAKKSGCTVHEVVLNVDAGPILAQAEVEIKASDTLESLKLKIQEQEHLIFAPAIFSKVRQLVYG